MDKISVKAGEWVVVCDGRKALILKNVGDQAFPISTLRKFVSTWRGEQARRVPMRPVASTNQSALPAAPSSRPTGTTEKSGHSWRRWRTVSTHDALSQDETPALIIVAAPRALGMLRDVYSPAVRKAIRAELRKDLVKLPLHEIEKELLFAAHGQRRH